MQTFARSIPCFLYGVIITHTLGDYYAHQNPNTMVLYKVSSSTCMYVGHLIMILLAITLTNPWPSSSFRKGNSSTTALAIAIFISDFGLL